MDKSFVVSIGDVIALNPSTDAAYFYGQGAITSAFKMTTSNKEIRGGSYHQLMYDLIYGRTLVVDFSQAIVGKNIMPLQTGGSIVNGAVDTFHTECLSVDASGNGTASKLPVGDIQVFKADGTTVTVTPTVSAFTVPGITTAQTVNVVYQYNTTVDRLAIGEDAPNVVKLLIFAQVLNSAGVKVEDMIITIPRLQLDGNYELAFTSDGVSEEGFSGKALAIEGQTCDDGSVFAYVDWVPASGSAVAVSDIKVSPEFYEPVAGVLSTQQLTVVGLRGSSYDLAPLTAECAYAAQAGGDADITVGAATGLISVAATSTAGDTANIVVTYGAFEAIMQVTVVAP